MIGELCDGIAGTSVSLNLEQVIVLAASPPPE